MKNVRVREGSQVLSVNSEETCPASWLQGGAAENCGALQSRPGLQEAFRPRPSGCNPQEHRSQVLEAGGVHGSARLHSPCLKTCGKHPGVSGSPAVVAYVWGSFPTPGSVHLCLSTFSLRPVRW